MKHDGGMVRITFGKKMEKPEGTGSHEKMEEMDEKISLSDISGYEMPDEKFDEKELKKGIEMETGYIGNPMIAKVVAKAHLSKHPKFYSKVEESYRVEEKDNPGHYGDSKTKSMEKEIMEKLS